MRKYWFFDLDGTLADTDRDIREAWKAAIVDVGLHCPHFDKEFIAGPSIDEMTKKLFPNEYSSEISDAIRVNFGRHYDGDGFPNTYEYPGIIEEVKRLKEAGAKVFIATNKRFAGARIMAQKFGWDKIFDGLYCGDMHKDDAIGKLRKPALLRLIMKEQGADRGECVMVGDTINDFEAARENGIFSIAVPWGYGTDEEKKNADLFLKSLPFPN
ncbi:MAG: HAD family hydrolase [Kiritimatiellae bacterium]|nr:HAD family hydrolase [Kiritimatiellia bacterium]